MFSSIFRFGLKGYRLQKAAAVFSPAPDSVPGNYGKLCPWSRAQQTLCFPRGDFPRTGAGQDMQEGSPRQRQSSPAASLGGFRGRSVPPECGKSCGEEGSERKLPDLQVLVRRPVRAGLRREAKEIQLGSGPRGQGWRAGCLQGPSHRRAFRPSRTDPACLPHSPGQGLSKDRTWRCIHSFHPPASPEQTEPCGGERARLSREASRGMGASS